MASDKREHDVKGYNLFISYSTAGDKAARKKGYHFLGRAQVPITGQEVKIYRIFKLSFKKKVKK